jgi:hypothetical protein
MLGIRGGKDVERRSMFDLLSQLCGRTEAENHMDAGFPLEYPA